MRPTRLALVAVITAAMVIGLVPVASAVPKRDRATLMEYAEDTWRSFEAMVDPAPGWSADNVDGDLRPQPQRATRRRPTSAATSGAPSSPATRASSARARPTQRMAQTLDTVAQLERHEPSGMFYNWYDPTTGDEAHHLAGGRQHRLPVPVQCGQRLAGDRADGGRAAPSPGCAAGRRALRADGLRLLLRPDADGRRPAAAHPRRVLGRAARPDCSPSSTTTATAARTSATPATTTARSTPSRASPPTSASPPARSRPSTTSRRGAPSRRPATARWPRASRSASGSTYLGVPVFEGAYPTAASTSCRPGAGACSRR